MRIIRLSSFLLVLCLGVSISSCKGDIEKPLAEDENKVEIDSAKTAKQSDGLILFTGKFVYFADAAVLETTTGIYGVIINDKMHELDKLVQSYKEEVTDFVPVAIRGKLIPKPENEEGWDNRIEIKEIIDVYKPNPEEDDVIKIRN